MQKYSDFFQTLHDETSPTGYLGAGTHYSVLRAVAFHDATGKPLQEGHWADFAVIWDKDHDGRVIDPIQQIYGRGLLSSFVMFGESKGFFTAVLSNEVSSADVNEVSSADDAPAPMCNPYFLRRFDGLELSLRAENCLKNDDIVYVGDLVHKTEAEMLRTPNFGRRSLNEIKEVLAQMGLHLGMEVPGYQASREALAHWEKEKQQRIARLELQEQQRITRLEFLRSQVSAICSSLDDPWKSRVVALEKASGGEHGIIADTHEKVNLYLRNLQMLWQLGMSEEEPEPEDEEVPVPESDDEEVPDPEEEPASVS